MSLFPLFNESESIDIEEKPIESSIEKDHEEGYINSINDILLHDKCQVCKKEDFKYKCPACLMKTCSVSCVKQHKIRNKCTGKKENFTFLPRTKLDEQSLINDYKYLTEVARISDNSERELYHKKEFKESNYNNKIKEMNRKLKQFNVHVIPLSKGMTKSKNNKSYWCHKQKTSIWTIEWKLVLDKVNQQEFLIHNNLGSKSLAELFPSKSKYNGKNNLKSDQLDFIITAEKNKEHPIFNKTSDQLYYFIKKAECNVKTSIFYQLDSQISFQQALSFIKIIEYPTIYVYSEIPENLKIEDIPCHQQEESISEESIKIETPKRETISYDDSDLLELEKELNIPPPSYDASDLLELEKELNIQSRGNKKNHSNIVKDWDTPQDASYMEN